MGDVYTIENQQPQPYLDQGQYVNGFVVTVRLHQWGEVARVNVPELDDNLIDQKIRALIAQREKLAQLGS